MDDQGEIKLANRGRGWPSSDDSIVTAVVRMAAAGEATKIPGRKGLYDFGITRPKVSAPVKGDAFEERAHGDSGIPVALALRLGRGSVSVAVRPRSHWFTLENPSVGIGRSPRGPGFRICR